MDSSVCHIIFMSIDVEKYQNILVYIFLNSLYLIYFVFLHDRNAVDLYALEYDLTSLKIHNDILSNLIFTLLAATLVYIIFSMY